jgi:tetratricopeptide (TPR) repeat protein
MRDADADADADAELGIREAELVTSEDDAKRHRQLIEDATRESMMAHRAPRFAAAGTAGGRCPYGRRLAAHDGAAARMIASHGDGDGTTAAADAEYARGCMVVGEMRYELGRMDDAMEMYRNALGRLMMASNDRDDDVDDDDCNDEARRDMISSCMRSIGSIHARCGEVDEARAWYDGALRGRMRIIDEFDATNMDASSTHHDDDDDDHHRHRHRHELGKIYNGLGALEAMMDGGGAADDNRDERAMSLFREAERNYLHGYVIMNDGKSSDDENGDGVDPPPPRRMGTTDESSSIVGVTKAVIERMTPCRAESLMNVRSNMAELLRKRGRYEDAIEMIRSALDVANFALEVTHSGATDDDAIKGDSIDLVPTTDFVGRGLDDRRNSIVDLMLQNAGIFMSANRFDDAAEAYERALSYHVYFRRLNDCDGIDDPSLIQPTILPAKYRVVSNSPPKLDLTIATKIEATIRHNLAHALAQIGQEDLSLEHYASSLAIKRHIVGDRHLEVATTLMDMGALIGGPLRDFTKALNCFKEALYIYRANLEECTRSHDAIQSAATSTRTFFDDEDAEEINTSIEKALKNISLIDAALLKDRDGASSKKRR